MIRSGGDTDGAEDGERWWYHAACRGQSLALFYGPPVDLEVGGSAEPRRVRRARESEALGFCARCPVREVCLREQLTLPACSQFGVAGGMSADERSALLEQLGAIGRRRPVGRPVRMPVGA